MIDCLTVGVDIDDNGHQFKHWCWPYTKSGKDSLALCGTKKLWGYDTRAPASDVDCPTCIERRGLLAAYFGAPHGLREAAWFTSERWQCPCGIIHPRHSEYCEDCDFERPEPMPESPL